VLRFVELYLPLLGNVVIVNVVARKMQSLRREFARARVLMELVLERELIKKV
jgi:hypothetical protein